MIINKLNFVTTILVTRHWQCCIGTTTIILHFCCWRTVWNRISWCWWGYQDFVSTDSFESGFNMANKGREYFYQIDSHWDNNHDYVVFVQNWAYLTKPKLFSPFSNLSGWLGKSYSSHLLFLIMPFLRWISRCTVYCPYSVLWKQWYISAKYKWEQ